MKHPKPDIGDTLRSNFLVNVATIKKLKKYWGTTTIDGVEVLVRRQYYYPTKYQSPTYEKLFKFLGTYEDIENAETEGVKKAWVYFNKNNGADIDMLTREEFLSDFVTLNLNAMWWDENDGARPEDLTLTTSIVIEAAFESATSASEVSTVTTTGLLDPSWPSEVLAAAVANNYAALWDTCLISQQGIGVINKGVITDEVTLVTTPDEDDLSPDDPWMQTIARNVMRTTDMAYTVTNVSIGYGKANNGRIYPTYVVTLEIPYMSFSKSNEIIGYVGDDAIATYTSATRTKLSYPNGYYTKTTLQKMSSSDLEDDDTLITREYSLWEDYTADDSVLWYKGCIRAEVLSNPRAYGTTYKKLSSYLLQSIASDYKKKKVSSWKKAIGIVIFILAVVFAPFTNGQSLWFIKLAIAIMFATVVLAILTLLASAMGAAEWASAFAAASKMVAPLSWVASIMLIWTGISQAITAAKEAALVAAKEAATEAAIVIAKEAATKAVVSTTLEAIGDAAAAAITEVSLMQTLYQLVVNTVADMVGGIITGATDLATMQATSASYKFLSGILKIFNTGQKLRLEQLNDRLVDKKAEYDAMMEETEQETDVLQGFARISASPATADWSMFAALYDYPYERSGGTLHTGNVLRTTKQAMRKATYEDLAFKDILVMA